VNHVGETLMQTRLAVGLRGDETAYSGLARSRHYRWFTDPSDRALYPEKDRAPRSRLIAANLHAAFTRDGAESRAAEIVDALLTRSPEFAGIWRTHPVQGPYCGPERLLHPQVGSLELHCQILLDPDLSQSLLVYTATPGSESAEKLRFLAVLGDQPGRGTRVVATAPAVRRAPMTSWSVGRSDPAAFKGPIGVASIKIWLRGQTGF